MAFDANNGSYKISSIIRREGGRGASSENNLKAQVPSCKIINIFHGCMV